MNFYVSPKLYSACHILKVFAKVMFFKLQSHAYNLRAPGSHFSTKEQLTPFPHTLTFDLTPLSSSASDPFVSLTNAKVTCNPFPLTHPPHHLYPLTCSGLRKDHQIELSKGSFCLFAGDYYRLDMTEQAYLGLEIVHGYYTYFL